MGAAVAAQSVLLPLDGTKFVTHRAPGPDNINWLSLFKSNKEKFLRRLLVLPILILIMLFPAGFFSTAMTVLDQLFCTESTPIYWAWYCETDSQTGRLLKRLVTGWLPSLLVTVWQNVIVTRAFYMVSLVECVAFSLSGVDKRITSLYFYWDFFNIFLGSVLGAGIFTLFGQALSLNDVKEILETLGQGITNSATFLTNYVLLRALFLVPFKLFFPHPGILNYVLRSILSVTCFKGVGITRRQRFQAWEPKSFMYGREAGTSLLMTLIGVAYCSTSPITVAIVAVYFVGIFVVVSTTCSTSTPGTTRAEASCGPFCSTGLSSCSSPSRTSRRASSSPSRLGPRPSSSSSPRLSSAGSSGACATRDTGRSARTSRLTSAGGSPKQQFRPRCTSLRSSGLSQ